MDLSARGSNSSKRRFPRAGRITSGAEIRSVLQRGKKSRTAHLDVFVSASPVPHSRAGVIVPRHKHTAVRRNRLKRQLREIVRVEILPSQAHARPTDLLIRARREAYDAAFSVLRDELVAWARRTWS